MSHAAEYHIKSMGTCTASMAPGLDFNEGRYRAEDLCIYCKGITASALAATEGYFRSAPFETLFDEGCHEKCAICARIRTIIESSELAGKVQQMIKQGTPTPIRLKLVHQWQRKGITGSAISLHLGEVEATSIPSSFT